MAFHMNAMMAKLDFTSTSIEQEQELISMLLNLCKDMIRGTKLDIAQEDD
jgi:hypothetical protein